MSMVDRFDALDQAGDELAAVGGPIIHPVHVAMVDVMSRLMAKAQELSTADTPLVLRSFVGMLEHARPMLLESLASAPPEKIRAFMTEMRDELDQVIDAPDVVEGVPDGGNGSAGGAPPRQDQSPPA